nr:unnamed protein product [Digitaria exilis]
MTTSKGADKKEVPAPSYRSLDAPVANPVDKFALLPAFLKVRGLVKEHIDSFNYFIIKGIRNIVEANNRIEARNDPNIYLRYTNVHVGTPSVQVDYKIEDIMPHFCRLTDCTYPCILHAKDEAELARLGECPLDPGGYFIVKGTEKHPYVGHLYFLSIRVIASVTSSTHEIKSKTVITLDKEKIYLQLNQFTKLIPIIVVMKAMGMESDQEVVQMVGRDPRYGDLLFPSIQECAFERIYTQQQALQYMDEKVTYPGAGNQKEGPSKSILRDVFIAHVPVKNGNFRQKCIYTGVMLRRMMDAILNANTFDDKARNKRLELSGQLISLLFEHLFKTMNSQAVELMNKNSDRTRSSPSDFSQLIKHESITSGLERAISTGNWDIKRFRMHRKGVSQVLSRLSYMASLGYMTRITPQFEKTRKTSGPRALQPSQTFANAMRKLRRSGIIGEFVSIFVNEKQLEEGSNGEGGGAWGSSLLGEDGSVEEQLVGVELRRSSGELLVPSMENLGISSMHCIHIASDGGLVCRPLIIADNGISRVKEHHMKELRLSLHDGIRSFDDFLRDGLIEYLDVNEENNALCAMGKQAMGNIAYNQARTQFLFRADSLLYLLVYAQRPLLTTKTIELVGYNKLGAGQNATVAVMGYSGYDIEDAIVMNKSSLDRGFGRCMAMKKYTVLKDNYGDGVSDRIAKPQRDKDGALVKQNMRALDEDGIAAPGQIIRNHDVYVNKQSPIVTDRRRAGAPLKDRDYKDSPAIYKAVDGETTVVDRVMLCSDTNDKLSIKCIIRHTRRPEVCRMTIGKMIELIGGKAGVSSGRFHYGSAFGEPSGNADKVEDISNTLVKHGFSYNGKDLLYSGILGQPLEAYIFMGPIYYQKLKHMVLDKMHARASGPRVLLTRQPTEGRSRDGGLRLGEMERDCLIAYGASMLIFERLLLSSDPYQVQVCRKCGLLGYYNYKLKASYCSMCKNGENMAKMRLPYACKLLFQELHAMNVVPRLKLTDG